MAHSLITGYAYAILKAPAAVSSDGYGSPVDISEYKGQAAAVLNAGAGTADSGVTPALAVAIYHAAETTDTFTALSGASFTARATTAGIEAINLDLRACKKYIKPYFDITGSGASYTVGMIGVFNDSGD